MIEQYMISIIENAVSVSNTPIVQKSDGFQVYRKSDGMLIDNRVFKHAGACKLMLRHKYERSLKNTWAGRTYGRAYWQLDEVNETEDFEDMENEIYQYLYSLFEFRKVL